MDYLRNLGNTILGSIPGLLAAIVVLLLALVTAQVAKLVVTKLLKASKLDQKLGRTSADEKKKDVGTAGYIGRLAFLLVFVLFLPSVFGYLGLQGVAAPISNMVNTIVGYLPNLLAAALILFIGFFVAKIIRDLLLPALRQIGLDRFQAPKTDTKDAAPTARLSTIVANIVYILILIPIVIAALQTLRIDAISLPAITMLNQIFGFIPQLLMAIVLISLGAFLARFTGNLLTSVLDGVGADRWLQDLLPSDVKATAFSLAKLVGRITQIVILLFFIVEGLNVIELEILQTIGTAIISYLPNVLISVLILAAALYLATWLEGLIRAKFTRSAGLATAAKIAVLILALFVVFDQLGIADQTINLAFRYLMLGVAIAFSLAFGLGGRDFASQTLAKLSKRADEVASDYRETQQIADEVSEANEGQDA